MSDDLNNNDSFDDEDFDEETREAVSNIINFDQKVHDLLELEFDENNTFQIMTEHEDLLTEIYQLSVSTSFYQMAKDKVEQSIKDVYREIPDNPEKRLYASLVNFMCASVMAPSFVPVCCVAYANFPIIYHFFLECKSQSEKN